MKNIIKTVSREKHLDHMVRVTPLIFLGYGLQCYFLISMDQSGNISKHLLGLGLALALMIGIFLLHDVYHQVNFFDEHMESGWRFSGKKKTINYAEIVEVEISEKDQKFASLILRLGDNRKMTFYFVDSPDELKKWIEKQKLASVSFSQAA